jgi:protein disulfide-isomerase A1
MKAVVGVVLMLALVACAAQASDVVVLTNDNFDEVLNNNAFVLVEFFAPWCGHCKRLAPEYEVAATALKDVAVLATVDCTVEEDLATRFSIQGFPTLKFFKRGEPQDYQGERNAKGIESWVKQRVEPSVVPVATKEAFDKFNERMTMARVVIFAGEEEDVSVFTEVAESAGVSEFSFGRVSSAELAEELGQKMGSIVLFYAHQNPVVYGDAVEAEKLVAFLKKAYPRLETLVLNQAFINRVTEAQRTMVIAFHENADQLEVIRKFAEEAGDEAHFSETPVAAYPELAAQWGASGTKYPTFVVTLWEDGHPAFKAFDEDQEFTVENAAQFLRECVSGKCTPFKKSQPIPDETESTENVRTLVYKNFDQVVKDSTKDVVVEFYAPWCGHCKALAPLYEEIATVFKPIDTVVIAKFDATQNYFDPSYNIRGFPTVLFFPANNKAEPLRYEGNRDFPSIAKFIMDNAALPIDPTLVSGPPNDPEVETFDEKEEL